MTVKKMRHIGVIVEDMARSIERFEGFGLRCTEVRENTKAGMKTAFFPVGDTMVEFLSFDPDKGWDPIHTVMRSQAGVLNHLCFEVDNLEDTIRVFEKNGARLIEGSPKSGAHGRIAFFEPETTEGVLIELCEV